MNVLRATKSTQSRTRPYMHHDTVRKVKCDPMDWPCLEPLHHGQDNLQDMPHLTPTRREIIRSSHFPSPHNDSATPERIIYQTCLSRSLTDSRLISSPVKSRGTPLSRAKGTCFEGNCAVRWLIQMCGISWG